MMTIKVKLRRKKFLNIVWMMTTSPLMSLNSKIHLIC